MSDNLAGHDFTFDELAEFDMATMKTSSRDQITRHNARLSLSKFEFDHGKIKCDAMFAELARREKAGLVAPRKEKRK